MPEDKVVNRSIQADAGASYLSAVHEPLFLPCARPEIDEETMTAVVEVLCSRWIMSGPKAEAFEAELSDYLDLRPRTDISKVLMLNYDAYRGQIREARSLVS